MIVTQAGPSQAGRARSRLHPRQVDRGVRRRSVCSTAGFTLLEIVIALGIAGLLMSALYGSYRAVADSILGTRPQTILDRKGQFFIQQLSRQVRCCYSGPVNRLGQTIAREKRLSEDLADRVALFRSNVVSHDDILLRYVTYNGTMSQNRYPGCLIVVSYRLDRWRHVLSAREELYGRRSGQDEEDWRDVLEDVLEIKFEYFDGEDWDREWDSDESGGPPRAVRVRLVLESAQGHRTELASVIPIQCSGSRADSVRAPEVPAGDGRRSE